MECYRLAGQEFNFHYPVPKLRPFELKATEPGTADEAVPFVSGSFLKNELISRTLGWVAEAQRQVETWSAPPGILMEVAGGSDFFIDPEGREIVWESQGQGDGSLNETDQQILIGPALVLALALRGTWCLHASAVLFKESLIVFLGESGQGKSTLAAALSVGNPGWQLVADDILPVTMDLEVVAAWPRFPQLKLPVEAQPGPGLPERLMLSKICVLTDTNINQEPGMQLLPIGQSVQVLLAHTAGTRMFDPELLTCHLDFCALAAGQVPVYRLDYPHRRDALPRIRELLESIC